MIDGLSNAYNPVHLQGPGLSRAARQQQAGQNASVFRRALEEEAATQQVAQQPQVEQAIPRPASQVSRLNPREPVPVASPARPAPQSANVERMVHEVTHLAQEAGYIGFSQDDILRAYNTGESFLADYTV